MKQLHSFLSVALALVLTSLYLAGCGSPDKSPAPPFTKITWEDSYEDMVALEGNSKDTFESPYNGTTYAYPKKYQDLDGTLKYMYNGDNKLMCVAWLYNADSNENLKKIYDTIHKQIESSYGKSGYDAENATNYGDAWYLDEGHITLTAVSTNSLKALQYAYMSPDASIEEEK